MIQRTSPQTQSSTGPRKVSTVSMPIKTYMTDEVIGAQDFHSMEWFYFYVRHHSERFAIATTTSHVFGPTRFAYSVLTGKGPLFEVTRMIYLCGIGDRIVTVGDRPLQVYRLSSLGS